MVQSARLNRRTDLIVTPGGWRPAATVHRLEPGHHLSGRGGGLKIIETASEQILKDLTVPTSSRRPRRPRRPRSRHGGPDAAILDIGWIQYAWWQSPPDQTIARFSAQWTVPEPPAVDEGQTLFFFIGLQQSETGPFVLQPVLQWGKSDVGGGRYWSVSNWYVNGQGSVAVQGPAPTPVQPGELLQAVIALTDADADGFSYTSSFTGYPAATTTVTHIEQLTWACATLEAYGGGSETPLSGCDAYPQSGSTTFQDVAVDGATANGPLGSLNAGWQVQTVYRTCGAGCSISGGQGSVEQILMSYG